jgi:hypothetical protein
MAGTVNASLRKMMSGCEARTSASSRSQKVSGFVWGLSSRNDAATAEIYTWTTARIAA